MRVTAEEITRETYDLCVIGAGPAGIILALEYEKQQPQHRILLIEYGPDQPAARNPLDDSIKIADTRNHHLPYDCTNKGLGGSSASWGGRCVMYDEIDFKPRDIINGNCTWDIPLLQESWKYADQTAGYFDCGDGKFNVADIPAAAGKHIAEKFEDGDVTDSVLERWSLPTRFGPRYRHAIESSKAIRLLSGWEVHSLAAGADGTITKLGLRDFGRTKTLEVAAKKTVIAAGAQESTRLLLKNKQIFRNGTPSALGKYYQGHISGKIASVRFYGDSKKTEYGFLRTPEGVYLRRRLQLSTDALLKNRLLNTALWLDNPLYSDAAHRNGSMSFMYLAMITPGLGKRLAPPAIAQAFTKGKQSSIGEHLKNVLKDLPGSLFTPARIFYSRYWMKRKLPGVFLYSPRNIYALHFHAEQVPDTMNRMELGPDGETLNIHYRYTDQDVDSVIRTHAFLDAWLRKCQCGELEYWYRPEELPAAIHKMSIDGLHQVGTTRIASNAADGVVDANLKVWGVPNLYVCSSSVFPTSGQANPTFFLGTFAVRLAGHLAKI